MKNKYVIISCFVLGLFCAGNASAQMAEVIKKNQPKGGGYYKVTNPLKGKKAKEKSGKHMTLIQTPVINVPVDSNTGSKGNFVSVTPMNDCFKKAKKLSTNGRYNVSYQKCLQKKVVVTPKAVDKKEMNNIEKPKDILRKEIEKGDDDDAFYTDIFKGFRRVNGSDRSSFND